MTREFRTFSSQIAAQHDHRIRPASTWQIEDHLAQVAHGYEATAPCEDTPLVPPRDVSPVVSLLTAENHTDWVAGISTEPSVPKSEVTLFLNSSTPQGANITDVLGYDIARIKVFPHASKLDKFIHKNLGSYEETEAWSDTKRIVMNASDTPLHQTADLLFQMWMHSENLLSPGLVQEYISQFDPHTQLIMRTPDIIKQTALGRRRIISHLYPQFQNEQMWYEIDQIVADFCRS